MTLYEKLGVRPIINAQGTMTALGGSLMEQETQEAMNDAASSFVDLPKLLQKAGGYLANLIGVEGVCITSGAAAGITIATAACVAGSDPVLIRQLPDCRGLKNEIIVQRPQFSEWWQTIRQAGVALVEIGQQGRASQHELEAACSDQTAAIFHFVKHAEYQSLPLQAVIEIGQARGIPVIVDAAAELPPKSNLLRFYEMGASLVIFSGGKMIRGPQSTGLIVGQAALIQACFLNASPHDSLGRGMKISKEEVAGLVTAVERFLAHDFAADMQRWERQVEHTLALLQGIEGLHARRVFPGTDSVLPSEVPRIYVQWEAWRCSLSPQAVRQRLLNGEPSIAVGEIDAGLSINPIVLNEGDEAVVASALLAVLTANSTANAALE